MPTRPTIQSDIPELARIHEACFPRQKESDDWIRANLAGHPETLSCTYELGSSAVGFAFWQQVSGFREKAVLELKQLAVAETHRGRGIGRQLITESLSHVALYLAEQGREPHYLLVKTGANNPAQGLYRSTLGVEPIAALDGIFSQTEIVLGGPYRTGSRQES